MEVWLPYDMNGDTKVAGGQPVEGDEEKEETKTVSYRLAAKLVVREFDHGRVLHFELGRKIAAIVVLFAFGIAAGKHPHETAILLRVRTVVQCEEELIVHKVP